MVGMPFLDTVGGLEGFPFKAIVCNNPNKVSINVMCIKNCRIYAEFGSDCTRLHVLAISQCTASKTREIGPNLRGIAGDHKYPKHVRLTGDCEKPVQMCARLREITTSKTCEIDPEIVPD